MLIDPGMGRRHLVRCLAQAEPEGFIAISRVQAMRSALRGRFPKALLNVPVGRRWFWGGSSYAQLLYRGHQLKKSVAPALPNTVAGDLAAIIYTSGTRRTRSCNRWTNC